VEYSDEETADSEQLESFRKFCEEQNSEGVQESTPSASNTEIQSDPSAKKAKAPPLKHFAYNIAIILHIIKIILLLFLLFQITILAPPRPRRHYHCPI
jgi:hypothetical protein